MLKQTFFQLLSKYSEDSTLMQQLWIEVEHGYSNKKRHYHTLQHLENLLAQLTGVKSEIQNWESILFSLYYHDLVYNPLKSDNEEKSAERAENGMKQISVPNQTITLVKQHILATKSYLESTNCDTNYFTDADLSVLGQSWEDYSQYYKNVRNEYAIYPDFVYNPGRKKVLNHFLSMDRIFKTDWFYQRLELQAKQNLKKEMELL